MTLEEALAQMTEAMSLYMMDTTAKIVQDTSKEVAYSVQLKYDDFFAELYSIVADRLGDAPEFLERYLPEGDWASISERWDKTKQKRIGMSAGANWHYNGISNRGTTGLPLSIRTKGKNKDRGISRGDGRTRRSSKRVSVSPFKDYIRSLQAAGTTERFFGPITLQYEFQAPDIGHKITPQMGLAEVHGELVPNVIRGIQYRKQGTITKFPKSLQLTAEIKAFGALQGVADLEWFLVDYIIKRIDPNHEKQWVKINGTRGPGKSVKGGRPIKPLIQPLVKFYINEALPRVIKHHFGD